VNFLDKLISDPECGPRIRSPLVYAACGLGLLFFALHACFTDSIRISKAGDGIYIHFSDHPKTFVVTVVGEALLGAWVLATARKRYLMHADK
jgi:hypothetical protein